MRAKLRTYAAAFLTWSYCFGIAASAPARSAEWRTLQFEDGKIPLSGYQALETSGSVRADRLFSAPRLDLQSFATGRISDTRSVSRYADKLDRIDDKLLFGIETSSGRSTSLFASLPYRGFDYSSSEIKLGYDLGGFTPYVSGSVTNVKPLWNAQSNFASPFEQGLAAQNPAFAASTSANIGAGFNYQAGANTSFSLGVTAGNARPPFK